jgi:hypothetical protein
MFCDTFAIKNSAWLPFVMSLLEGLNNNGVLCCVLGQYPEFLGGILQEADCVTFYILNNIALSYEYHVPSRVSECICSVMEVLTNDNRF